MAWHTFLCPNCHKEVSVPVEAVSKVSRCNLCGAFVAVPTREQDASLRERLKRTAEAEAEEERRGKEAEQTHKEDERRQAEAERFRQKEEESAREEAQKREELQIREQEEKQLAEQERRLDKIVAELKKDPEGVGRLLANEARDKSGSATPQAWPPAAPLAWNPAEWEWVDEGREPVLSLIFFIPAGLILIVAGFCFLDMLLGDSHWTDLVYIYRSLVYLSWFIVAGILIALGLHFLRGRFVARRRH